MAGGFYPAATPWRKVEKAINWKHYSISSRLLKNGFYVILNEVKDPKSLKIRDSSLRAE